MVSIICRDWINHFLAKGCSDASLSLFSSLSCPSLSFLCLLFLYLFCFSSLFLSSFLSLSSSLSLSSFFIPFCLSSLFCLLSFLCLSSFLCLFFYLFTFLPLKILFTFKKIFFIPFSQNNKVKYHILWMPSQIFCVLLPTNQLNLNKQQ